MSTTVKCHAKGGAAACKSPNCPEKQARRTALLTDFNQFKANHMAVTGPVPLLADYRVNLSTAQRQRLAVLKRLNPSQQLATAQTGTPADQELLARAGGAWVTEATWQALINTGSLSVLTKINDNNRAPERIQIEAQEAADDVEDVLYRDEENDYDEQDEEE